MTRRNKLVVASGFIVFAVLVVTGFLMFRTPFMESEEKTEKDVTFTDALMVFNAPSDTKLVGEYKYSHVGFIDDLYQLAFTTDSVSLEMMKTQYDLSSINVSTEKMDEKWWDTSKCFGEESQHQIEVEGLQHAHIIFCPLTDMPQNWNVYLVGGTT